MSGFSLEWLNLREAADQRARNPHLREQALHWLGLGSAGAQQQIGEAIVVDLGTGTGSTLRALAAPGSQNLVWRLVDNDGLLLDEALRRHGKHYRIEDYQSDLSVIGELPLGGARLVTASALFDLMPAAFIDALVNRLSLYRAKLANGLYAALNYDGTTVWNPAHPYDANVLGAFNEDQRRDKGTGLALGPEAGNYLVAALRQAGFTVQAAASPWRLGASDTAMTESLITGIADAVAESDGIDATLLANWCKFRLAHAASGTCTVGHVDVLALP
jgi:hypothetical protein